MSDLEIKAREIIANNEYMTIASASAAGRPWISPVFFAYDSQFQLFWVSNKNARHSNLIRANRQIAIVIFDSSASQDDVDAVYLEADAGELSVAQEIEHARKVLNQRITKEMFLIKRGQDVIGDAVWRIYKAVPTRVCKLVDGEFINGQYVDKHVDISLN